MSSLNHTAGLLLKLSIEKLFPHAKNCHLQFTPQEFSCVFDYKEAFQETYLPLIEKQMREFASLPFSCSERLASNVKELCHYHNKEALARACEGEQGMIWLVEVGPHWALAHQELMPVSHFALFSFNVQKGKVTLTGQAFKSEEEKQKLQKKWRRYDKKNHRFYAQLLGLYENGHLQPRGVQFKSVLHTLWKGFIEKGGISEVETEDPLGYREQFASSTFATWDKGGDQLYFFDQAALPVALKMMADFVSLFGLCSKWVLVAPSRGKALASALKECGFSFEKEEGRSPSLELRISDAIERFWTGPSLAIEQGQIIFSLLGDTNLFMALLLEHFEGELPYWLQPEQVRLLPIGGVDIQPLLQIFNRQAIRFSIDKEDLPVKEKWHRALRMKVPYVMVFGKQEAQSGRVTIRVCGSNRDMSVKVEDLESFLLERKLES